MRIRGGAPLSAAAAAAAFIIMLFGIILPRGTGRGGTTSSFDFGAAKAFSAR